MPDIYSGTGDGKVQSLISPTWAGARDTNGGASASDSASNSSNFVAVQRFAARTGGNTTRVTRSFLTFDVSSITSAVAEVELKIYGYSGNDGTIWGVKGLNYIGSLSIFQFDEMPGFSAGNQMFGNVTQYTEINTGGGNWSTSGYNSLTGTSDLRDDIESENAITIVMTDSSYDARNLAPSSNGTFNCGGYYSDDSSGAGGTDKDPYLAIKLVGYGHDVNTVGSSNIVKINTVATANVAKVITV